MDHIIAVRLQTALDKGMLPDEWVWRSTPSVFFCTDWQGENEDPPRGTSVQMLWSPDFLYVRFRCRFREIYAYDDCFSRRDELWLRDVAEVFIQPDTYDPGNYKEFEISPNGDWLDLDICQGNKSDLLCDLISNVTVRADAAAWIAELAIPFSCMTDAFDPGKIWRLNLFRIEGAEPNRFYSAWQPTYTPQPNFHVPEQFGELHFV
jgi:hypothetical protein